MARARETREAREAQKTGATGGRRAPAPLPVHRTAQRSSYEGWYGRWDRWKGRTHENKAFSLPKDNSSGGGGDDDDDDKLNSKESNVYAMYIYTYVLMQYIQMGRLQQPHYIYIFDHSGNQNTNIIYFFIECTQ